MEVIGKILSRVGVERDVLIASLTCRKWREAYRKHLHTLSFNVAHDSRVYCDLPTADLEALIAKTLFQTSGVKRLSILMNSKHKFSSGSIVGWLFFVRETLLELFYKVSTSPSINVLDICGGQRLETLSLCECTIKGVEPNFQRFPCLTSLSLRRVSISAEDLNSLLLAFPKLERLELSNPIIRAINDAVDSVNITIKLRCPTIKSLILKDVDQSKFILENGCIECVDVNHCYFGSFKVSGSNSSRHFKFFKSKAHLLDIEEGDNLELWILIKFLRVPHRLDIWQYFCVFPTAYMENLVLLEIGWDSFDGFWDLVEKVLKYCPNVRKLIVHGTIPKRQDDEFFELFGQHTTSMVETMRKYHHIEVQILYSSDFYSSNPLTDRWLL
ncbi:hypothetical protein DM860_009538 [Cuscuta australis]|uniref:F-box/LRR-repeat protein 15/At3g58940/PEG3-like LRR domain-containing protein n=1 Tax=Cuscuta australis TaxID=267555 RepID=A0A328DJI8_9ASTE|nr:hypothetical protein DM860_009538 [Cuscuta australis]